MNEIKKELFNEIIAIKKYLPEKFNMPINNQNSTVELISANEKLKLILDVDRRGRLELKKSKIQERYKSLPIIRVDIDSPPHRFADGSSTTRNHIHIYNPETGKNNTYNLEEFDDTLFKQLDMFSSIFFDFCLYCNIDISNIQGVI